MASGGIGDLRRWASIWRRHVLAAVVAAVALASCSSGDGEPEVPADPRQSPEAVAEALLVLWQDRDREAADRLGPDAALDSLFQVTPPSEPMEVSSCDRDTGVEGAITCVASGGRQRVLVTVVREGGQWEVFSVLPIR